MLHIGWSLVLHLLVITGAEHARQRLPVAKHHDGSTQHVSQAVSSSRYIHGEELQRLG